MGRRGSSFQVAAKQFKHLERLLEVVRGNRQESLEGAFQLGGRNILGARKVHDITIIFQEVKLPFPLITYGKYVDIVLLDVLKLLFPAVFGDYQVNTIDSFDDGCAL